MINYLTISSKSCHRCASRGSLIVDYNAGDVICSDCGEVNSTRIIDESDEVRIYNNDSNNTNRTSRCSYVNNINNNTGIITQFYTPKNKIITTDKQLRSVMNSKELVSSLERAQRLTISNKEFSLQKNSNYILEACAHLNIISNNIKDCATELFHRIVLADEYDAGGGNHLSSLSTIITPLKSSETNIGQKRERDADEKTNTLAEESAGNDQQISLSSADSVKVAIAACIYLACRLQGYPRTVEEITASIFCCDVSLLVALSNQKKSQKQSLLSSTKLNQVSRIQRKISQQLRLNLPRIKPVHFVDRIAGNVKLPPYLTSMVIKCCGLVSHYELFEGMAPQLVAAGAIIIVCIAFIIKTKGRSKEPNHGNKSDSEEKESAAMCDSRLPELRIKPIAIEDIAMLAFISETSLRNMYKQFLPTLHATLPSGLVPQLDSGNLKERLASISESFPSTLEEAVELIRSSY